MELYKPTPDEIVALKLDAKKFLAGLTGKKLDLSGADLSGADLRSANLSGAYLSGAYLSGADLRSANLSGANLSGAYLSGANLSGANLSGADLSGAYLRSAYLSGAESALALARTEIVPREGVVHGWKKCYGGVLVKLLVPADARRSNATGRKCRAERAEVIEVVGAEVGLSLYDGRTEYRVGEVVKPDGWNENRLIECGQGIHFYMTKEEAEAHV